MELNELKVGDEVGYLGGYSHDWCVKKIDRVTATQFIVDGERFNRANGREIGASLYHKAYIEPLTPELREQCECGERKQQSRKVLLAIREIVVNYKLDGSLEDALFLESILKQLQDKLGKE